MGLRWVILSVSGMTALPLNSASGISSRDETEGKSTLTNSVLIGNPVAFDSVVVGFLKHVCSYTLYHLRS